MRDEATSPLGQTADWLTACYKSSEFPKLKSSLVAMQTHSFMASIWTTGFESKGNWCQYAGAHAAYCAKGNKMFSFWPKSLMSSASNHETVTGWNVWETTYILLASKHGKIISQTRQFWWRNMAIRRRKKTCPEVGSRDIKNSLESESKCCCLGGGQQGAVGGNKSPYCPAC